MASPLQISIIQARQQHRLHQVNMLEPALCRVGYGTKRVFLGEQTVEVGAGQWLLLPSKVTLDIENEPNSKGYKAEVLSFSQQLVSEFHQLHAQDLPQVLAQPSLQQWHMASPNPRLDDAWLRLQKSLENQEAPALQKHLFFEILLIIGLSGRLWPLLGQSEGALSLQVQQLLMSDPAADWSQEHVAAQFNRSSSTLRRHLAAEGETLRGILYSVRMTYALGNLQTTRRRVEDIAQACGYASASRFSVRFRERFGLSPRALRKAIGKKAAQDSIATNVRA